MLPASLIPHIALAGALLGLLLPIGTFIGTNSFLFHLIFFAHLVVHLRAVGTAIRDAFAVLRKGWLERSIGACIALPFFVILICLAFLPITARDALIHHIAVPKWWITAGDIIEIPWHHWSYYPMLIELASIEFLSWHFESAITLYQVSFLILLIGVLSQFAKTTSKTTAIATLLAITTPIIVRLSSTPYVDLPLVVYGLGAFHILITNSKMTWHYAIVAGSLLGLCAATKYNGLLFAAVMGLAFLFKYRTELTKLFPGLLLSGGVIAFPWYCKNYILTGNPLFPLLPEVFGTTDTLVRAPEVTKELLQSTVPTENGILKILSLPFQMMLTGQDGNPAFFDGILSPVLLFAVFSLFSKSHRRVALYGLSIFLAYSYGAIALSGPRTRYLAPVLGVLVLLAALGLEHLLHILRPRLRQALTLLIVCFQAIWGYSYLYTQVRERSAIAYFTGETSKSDYIQRRVSEALLANAINIKLSEHSKTYLLYTGNRYALYDHPVINSGYYSDRLLLTWILHSSSPEEIRLQFQISGITNVAIHRKRYESAFKSYLAQGFLSSSDMSNWNTFVATYLVPQFEVGPYQIWSLKDAKINE